MSHSDALPLDPLPAVTTVFGGRGRHRPGAELPGTLGRFEVMELLGEGGMGRVYRARQVEPVDRDVALKVIRAGRPARGALRRFQREGQALARMNHPNVATVYEVGTFGDRPYLAMEPVAGESIARYCERSELEVDARVELFLQVCAGVHHAHQKGVLHRDLKPSNVLVTVTDGAPLVKVIDFGVARLDSEATRDEPAAQPEAATATGIVGTLAYMSPEQARDGDDLDIRSDVYSLGVLLHELLVGEPPFRFRSMADLQLLGSGEAPPTPPSDRLRSLAREQAGTATARLLRRARRLGGDLDAIVLRALARDREVRYPSALELAADLRRHLARVPVIARPATPLYRARRFFDRHRGAALSAALVALALVAGTVAASVGLVRSRRAEAAAEIEAAKAAATRDFLVDMLASVRPAEAGRDVMVREVLDRASGLLADGWEERPDVAITVGRALAQSYLALGALDAALAEVDRAVARQSPAVAPNELAIDRAEILEAKQDAAGALAVLATFLETPPADPLAAARVLRIAAAAQLELGETTAARELLERALAVHTGDSRPARREEIAAQGLMTGLLLREGRYPEAERLARRLVERAVRVLGEDHPDSLAAMNDLAGSLFFQTRFADLEAPMRRLVEASERVLGPEHPIVLDRRANLATVLGHLGDPERTREAIELGRLVLAESHAAHGATHPSTLKAGINLATLLYNAGLHAEAEERFTAILGDLPADHPRRGLVTYNLAGVLLYTGKSATAVGLLDRLIEERRQALGDDHPETLRARMRLAFAMNELGRFADSAAILEDVLARQVALLGADHLEVMHTQESLLVARYATGDWREVLALGRGLLADAEKRQDFAIDRENLLRIAAAEIRLGDAAAGLALARPQADLESDAWSDVRREIGAAITAGRLPATTRDDLGRVSGAG